MTMIAWPTARDINRETIACIDAGNPVWDRRTLAYWKAYRRRLRREIGPQESSNWQVPASECLIALAGAMQRRVTS